jgi:aminotransferase
VDIHSYQPKNIDNFINNNLKKISPSGIRKFFELLFSTEDVVSLSIGEPDFITPRHIRDAATSALERGYTMYTSNYGMLELRQEIARHLESLYQVIYKPESEILVTVGTSQGLDLALRAITNYGDEVIIPDPCYVAYSPCIVLAGGVPVSIPTSRENNFAIKASDIESHISSKTKAILIGYPSNPTGAIMPVEELSQIAELAHRYNLLVISDEIYSRLTYGIKHTCFTNLPETKDNTILIGGFSKSYAMTGWRIGYIAASNRIIEAMTRIHQYTMLCAPIMVQMAAIEALKHGENDVMMMLKEYDRRRHILVDGLNAIGLDCFEPKGAFYTFPSIESTGMTSEDFSEKLLLEEKVAVIPGSAFGCCGEGYVRCSYATPLNNIEEALNRIQHFISKHKQG